MSLVSRILRRYGACIEHRQPGHPEGDHPAGTWHVCSCNAWFDDSCVRWRPAA